MNQVPQIESRMGRLVISTESNNALPLQKTVIQGQVIGPLISVLVTQQFANPLADPAELDYLFPLPSRAAIVDFELHIGSRTIQADIQELEQARQAYEEASQNGQQAGLLEQHRPNLFAIHLTNVLPGEEIQAAIRYQDRLKFEDGAFELVFPMGLTPRYNTHEHPAEEESAQTSSPAAGVGEEIGKVEIQLSIDAGAGVADPTSPTHPLRVSRLDERRLQVSLAGEHIPDHDFVLRYALKGASPEACLWTSHDETEDYLLAALFPPALPEDFQPPQREFVFVLDRSGSMSGVPITQAHNALQACLRSLNPGDIFRILLFDDQLEWYSNEPANVTQSEIDQADRYLKQVEGRGGTEILQALEAIFKLPADPKYSRYILFLTDGAVSAEERALQQIRKKLDLRARLFTFGIGPSVNRALLEQMAALGRGTAEFLQLDEDIEGAIIRFQDRVSFPILTDLTLTWECARGWDILPAQLPDLYAGQPLEICGRFQISKQPASLVVHGIRSGKSVEMRLALQPAVSKEDAVQRVWSRAQVDTLLNQIQNDSTQADFLRQQVIGLALRNRLVTPYTAFVAVDRETALKDTRQRKIIHIAQPLPKDLNRAGFMVPSVPPVMPQPYPQVMSAASTRDLDLPAFLRRSHSNKDNFRRISEDIGPAMPPEMNLSIQTSGAIQAPGNGMDTLEDALRWLTRTQRVDGSWNADGEHTAAALLAFVRHGHTTRTGDFRQIVKRAFSWLESHMHQGGAEFVIALALAELAQATGLPGHQKAASAARARLLSPVSALDKVVMACIENKILSAPGGEPGEIDQLDDLRISAVLKKNGYGSPGLLQGPDADLARTWNAVLK